MANNFYNFYIPDFNTSHGSDWANFKTIVDENVDNLFAKIWQLYWLRDPAKMGTRALEYALRLRGVKFDTGDTISVKRYKLRSFVKNFTRKGLADTYLDIAESVTGIRGSIGYSTSGWVWDESDWETGEWGGIASSSIYNIFFNVKTSDETELDRIESLLREKSNRPAFYQLILINDDQNILRTI